MEEITKEQLVQEEEKTKEETNQTKDEDLLKVGVGTKEATTLKPAEVVVLNVAIKPVGTKNAKMLECFCSHPDKQDGIKISSVKWEYKGKLEVQGLWFNKDEDGLLRKGSALAEFLGKHEAATPEALVGKKMETILDDKGYLAFKNY